MKENMWSGDDEIDKILYNIVTLMLQIQIFYW